MSRHSSQAVALFEPVSSRHRAERSGRSPREKPVPVERVIVCSGGLAPEDFIASGDKVVVRVRATGMNTGDFMGVAATGKTMEIQLIDIVRFEDDGLGHEDWGVADVMTMMQQLRAVPVPDASQA